MLGKNQFLKKILSFLRVIVAAFIITGILLLLLAFVLFKWELNETLMTAGTLVIYILSCFSAGFLIGKSGREHGLLWGMLAGTSYYLLLLMLSLFVSGTGNTEGMTIFLNLLICTASGMIGAMVFRK